MVLADTLYSLRNGLLVLNPNSLFQPKSEYILSSRIFTGASIGHKWKFNPEISYDFFPYSGETVEIFHGETTLPNGMIVVGFSIQRIF